jgi:hypothetical protein
MWTWGRVCVLTATLTLFQLGLGRLCPLYTVPHQVLKATGTPEEYSKYCVIKEVMENMQIKSQLG